MASRPTRCFRPRKHEARTAEAPADDAFYEFTEADYFRAVAAKPPAQKGFVTKAAREAERQRRINACPPVRVRLLLPGGHAVEAEFGPTETRTAIRQWANDVVVRKPVELWTTPPRVAWHKRDDAQICFELAPAVIVRCTPAGCGTSGPPEADLELIAPGLLRAIEDWPTGAPQNEADAAVREKRRREAAATAAAEAEAASAAASSQGGKKPAGAVPKWFKR